MCFALDGPVLPENFAVATPLCEEMLARRGDIRMLIQCRNFTGWSEETARLDMSFTLHYGAHISRIALVNPPPSMISLFKIKDALHKRDVRYFGEEEFDKALAWVNGD